MATMLEDRELAEMNDEQGEFPEGWSQITVRELVSFAIGGDWGVDDDRFEASLHTHVRVIRSTEFRDWQTQKGKTAVSRYIKKASLSKRILVPNNLVIEISGGGPNQPVGRVILIDDSAVSSSDLPIICSNFCRKVELNTSALPQYVTHYLGLMNRTGELNRFQTETTNIRNLNFNDFLDQTRIPIPPLPEQKRIVAKVEELLAQVNAARDRLARVPQILKRFRQSVLAAACSGRLTEDWRGGEPDMWTSIQLDHACTDVVDCPHSTPKWSNEGQPCLRTNNIRDGFLDLTDIRRVSDATFMLRTSRLKPRPGDIVYSREGGILGNAAAIPDGFMPCLGQRMMLFRPSEKVLESFLLYFLSSPSTKSIVRSLTGGSASPHLNVGDVKQFVMSLPPRDEQREIVRRVESLFAVADKVEASVKAAALRADKLTQSILSKAFRGELVPTDADLGLVD